METIREWASQITESQKSSFNSSLTDELLKRLKDELSSDTPDYEGCVVALTTLHHQSVAAFYKRLYPKMSGSTQQSINAALLNYANMRPGKAACSRIAQAIQQRLKNGDSAEALVPELKWYIENASEKTMQINFKSIWSGCGSKNCLKLFEVDLTDWQVDRQKLQSFYSYFLQMLRTTDGKTDGRSWNSIFISFWERNHLSDAGSNDEAPASLSKTNPQPAPSSDVSSMEKVSPTAPSPSEAPSSIPVQNTAPDKIVDVHKDTEDNTTGKAPDSAEKPMVHDLPEPPTTAHKESTAPSLEMPQPEPDPDNDGVKLAERLLAWARREVQGANVLKSSLRSSNNDLKKLEGRFSNLQSELFAAKEEIAAKEVTITALQRDLADANAKLKEEQAKSAELDGMVSKLQQMNENSAVQAVLGYKAELASALKSIVEDARLPEAQHDAEILSALLADLLDTLHFKGVPLEVDEK